MIQKNTLLLRNFREDKKTEVSRVKQKLKRIAPGLYAREYEKANGEKSLLYYGRLTYKGERLLFALGSDLREAKDKLAEIKIANRRGEDLSRFKPEKKADRKTEPRAEPMTF